MAVVIISSDTWNDSQDIFFSLINGADIVSMVLSITLDGCCFELRSICPFSGVGALEESQIYTAPSSASTGSKPQLLRAL